MYKLTKNVIYDTDNESNKKYLMDIEGGTLYQLNETAAILIEKITNGSSVEDYISFLTENIDEEIDIERIKNDVEVYINQLVECGFIIEEDE